MLKVSIKNKKNVSMFVKFDNKVLFLHPKHQHRTIWTYTHLTNTCSSWTIKAQGLRTVFIRSFISSYRRCSVRKGVIRNFAKLTGKHLCRVSVGTYNFIKKEALSQVLSWEFCEISKNNFSHRTPLVAAPGSLLWKL